MSNSSKFCMKDVPDTINLNNSLTYQYKNLKHIFQRGGISQRKSGKCRIRRHSLTTLHSLPISEKGTTTTSSIGIERQSTVPHGFNVRFTCCQLFWLRKLQFDSLLVSAHFCHFMWFMCNSLMNHIDMILSCWHMICTWIAWGFASRRH